MVNVLVQKSNLGYLDTSQIAPLTGAPEQKTKFGNLNSCISTEMDPGILTT